MDTLYAFYWNYIMIKKYPIGTKIRFLYDNYDKGKWGTIVGISKGHPLVVISEASGGTAKYGGIECNWKCLWEHIEPIGHRQLLFDFMYE